MEHRATPTSVSCHMGASPNRLKHSSSIFASSFCGASPPLSLSTSPPAAAAANAPGPWPAEGDAAVLPPVGDEQQPVRWAKGHDLESSKDGGHSILHPILSLFLCISFSLSNSLSISISPSPSLHLPLHLPLLPSTRPGSARPGLPSIGSLSLFPPSVCHTWGRQRRLGRAKTLRLLKSEAARAEGDNRQRQQHHEEEPTRCRRRPTAHSFRDTDLTQ